MAERRMFAKEVVCSDAFCALNPKAQLLYFRIGMIADDDGVCASMRTCLADAKAKESDLQALIDARFILKRGPVYVVKHWRKNNYIRPDRYKETAWTDELEGLFIKPDGTYTERSDDPYFKAFLEVARGA